MIRRCALIIILAFVVGPLRAEVVRIEITERMPFAEGHRFGSAGRYERVKGWLHLEVDPSHEANGRVTDLELAPVNDRGRVAFRTEFFLLKPLDARRGNGRVLYDVNNRGNKLALGAFNRGGGNDPRSLADAGNGFLMRRGYAVLWCGWNGDVRPGGGRMMIELPVARRDGKPITGRIYAEICVNNPVKSQPFYWGNSNAYPAVSLDNGTAVLTARPDRRSPPREITHDKWSFAREQDGKPVPDPKHLYLAGGFKPGWLYELVYTGRDPRVTGLGFVAARDCISFFRFADADRAGTANPLAGAIEKSYIFGISQSGRFIHHFLYDGFNTDEAGRMVIDGAMPHVGGGGKGQFNFRFAQTTRHGSQHQDNLFPSDFFPFNSVPQTDPVTGRTGDSFARSRRNGHLPKIFFSETSTEYWCRAGSLLHTDVEGKRDAAIDPKVRLYYFAGAQHGNSSSPRRGNMLNQRNTLNHRPLLRAMLVALDRWVSSGIEPPASRYPRIADGTLVTLEKWQQSFPALPGVRKPEVLFAPLRLDSGPRWHSEGIADFIPPKVGRPFVTLVPAVDADGIELAGIRLPGVSVPLATYAGWNIRDPKHGAAGMLGRWSGSRWPLPRTRADREQSGDPRRSILERYPTRADYLAAVTAAALELQGERRLLDEDVTRILQAAARVSAWERGER